MLIELNNKKIEVPNETIRQYMRKLELTEDGAIALYLEEEGYIENKEMIELDKKAKENKTNHGIEQKQRKKREYISKTNENKQFLIKNIAEFLKNMGIIDNISIENSQKIITFEYNQKKFKLDLIETREKKK